MAENRKLRNEELDRLDVDRYRSADKWPITVVLDNVRSAHNVGAVFRTSDAFRIRKIWLCGITATPPHREIRKTALGATESVVWDYAKDSPELIRRLKKAGIRCLAVEQAEGACPLQEFQPPVGQELALVFGHEVDGVSQEVIDACGEVLEIPQFGTKHSLNLSVATGLVLWDLISKLGIGRLK